MAKLRFVVEFDDPQSGWKPTPEQPIRTTVAAWASAIAEHLGARLERVYNAKLNLGVIPLQPDPMASDGKHGMDDGKHLVRGVDLVAWAPAGMVPNRPAAVDKPEKPSPDCTCGMGLGAQPTAHNPSCGAYSGSVIVYHGLPNIDKAVQSGEILANRGSGEDGAEKDVSEQHRKRIEDFDAMLSAARANSGLRGIKVSLDGGCRRCGIKHDSKQADSSAPFRFVDLPPCYGVPGFAIYLCGPCTDLVLS